MKRCLLLGRISMTNLDSVLKFRDITLLTKFHIVKAMVFLEVMYGCERWVIKKAGQFSSLSAVPGTWLVLSQHPHWLGLFSLLAKVLGLFTIKQ